jgi:acyl CoA:acetate/3-ketoacid CoA transferase alpha subunit
MKIGPVVVAPVIVTAVVERLVTTDEAGPEVVITTGVFVKAVGNV